MALHGSVGGQHAVLLAVLAFGCGSGGTDEAQSENRSGTSESQKIQVSLSDNARASWQRLKDAAPEGDYETHDWAEYWIQVLYRARAPLWEFLESSPDDESLRAFLDQFGRHGAQADLRLLFCAPHMMLPGSILVVLPLDPQKHGISGEAFHSVRLRVCKAQVEVLIADVDRLKRYHHAVVWDGSFLRAGPGRDTKLKGAVKRTAKGFAEAEADEQVWYVRDFLVLAVATNRVDLIRGRHLADMKEAWDTWHAWYLERESALRFDADSLTWKKRLLPRLGGRRRDMRKDIPKHPFPDWQGPPPPDQNLIGTYDSSPGSFGPRIPEGIFSETEDGTE